LGPEARRSKARGGILLGRDPAVSKTKTPTSSGLISEVGNDETDLSVGFRVRKSIEVCSESDERILSLKKHGQGIDTPLDIYIIRHAVEENLF
jgi:hypothetical protein